jgi:Predicted AAA-ATPase/PD-(D/E)XK nuclease superfamily
MSLRAIPIGISDFRELREQKLEYVDKTQLITELVDHSNVKVVLLPRPRRFGKTLNLSMLRWFFEKRDENLWPLFEGLHMAQAGEKYRAYFQKYPVIFISFKGTKADTFESCFGKLLDVIQQMYKEHAPALEGKLSASDAAKFQAIIEGTANQVLYELSLKNLTQWLHEVHGQRPIVLIDEYDAPIHAGYLNNYYNKAVGFVRSLFEAALKDNDHLERAVMTGILRVSKESIFSGLNNIGVYSLLAEEFNTCFGFTDVEVMALMQKAEVNERLEGVRSYYNGYDFGGVSIYNPWSILYFLASKSRELMPYWLNTSSNDLIKEQLKKHAFSVQRDIHTLLEGGSIEKKLDENVVFADLDKDPRSLWSLLVFSGYLKATRGPSVLNGPPPRYHLSIPNLEVDEVYRTTFRSWLDDALLPRGATTDTLIQALLEGNVEGVEIQLGLLVAYMMSYHDINANDPERFYHGLMIGLLAALEPEYEVRSNRESGEGRPDVLIKPRYADKPGVVLELKAARKGQRTIKQALNEGLKQFLENDYAAELRNAGVTPIQSMVIAFDGKSVLVRSGVPAKKKVGTLKKVGAAVRKVAKKVTAAGKTKREKKL